MGLEVSTVFFGASSVALFYSMLRMLSTDRIEKAVTFLDHLSKMGSREIARSYSACLHLVLMAGGAGLITAGTVVLKMRILHASFGLFWEGSLIALNFIGSFFFMQVFGFRLATKIAPLVGTTLAKSWTELRDTFGRRLIPSSFLKNEIAWGLRTQVFGALGNLAFVIVAAYAFHWIYILATGHAFLDQASARATLESLHPWRTATLPYAAFTGLLLWVSTLAAGATASWFRPFSKTTASALFNVFLGAFLAFTPVMGRALGVPLDVRHFTLSGGMVAISAATLGLKPALQVGLASAFMGTILIGFLNFTVSFGCAFLITWWNGEENERPQSGTSVDVFHPRFATDLACL
jgi:site-specific recombinase